VSLLGSLIAVGVAAVVSVGIYDLILANRLGILGFERRELASSVIAGEAARIAGSSFVALHGSCDSLGRWQPNPPSSCRTGDQLAKPQPVALTGDVKVNQRLRWTGEPHTEGELCLEIGSCRSLGGGRLLEVTLLVHYEQPSRNLGQVSLTFRRTRW
jgi:hypothetical protein